MRSTLAEKLLIRVMGWTPEEVSIERPLIQAMANLKYDEYQQFSPGIRFTESMAQWLNQFEPAERHQAYNFIKSNLIFITSEQIAHLVNICFAEKINPFLMQKTAKQKGIENHLVRQLYNSTEYKEIKRRSLFLGISDGAKIDQLRRSSGISNEQVFSSYYISTEKKDDMLNELHSEGYDGKFSTVFLVDDFTGSGLSYFRKENGNFTGKICKFLKLIYNIDNDDETISVLPDLIDNNHLSLNLIFYIARAESINYIKEQINQWKAENNLTFLFSVDAIQLIENNVKEEVMKNEDIVALSKKYINDTIIDRHFKKGKHNDFYLGFDECALPLVLHHNSPNNSLPILWWYPESEEFRGLFPRITRHRE